MGEDMASEQMDKMLTVREVARLLHVHPNTLRRWSNNGRIRAYRITPRGDRRFKREDVARFLAELSPAKDNAIRVR
jgi:excisionase family DNA binding protein